LKETVQRYVVSVSKEYSYYSSNSKVVLSRIE
jgi:hypothetical protein